MSKILESEDKIIDLKSSLGRFPNELTELILSYLPISEKIRLECTSKQVQSLIFNKQYCLRISNTLKESEFDLNNLVLKGERNKKVKVLGTVLKKLKNLDTIIIQGFIYLEFGFVDTIADHCRQLKTLSIDGNCVVTDYCLQRFVQKCGSTLQVLKFDGLLEQQMKQLMSSAPDLRSVTVNDIKSVISDDNIFGQNSEELPKPLPKLQEIEFKKCKEKTLNQFQNQYSDNLLKISCHLSSGIDFDLMSAPIKYRVKSLGRMVAGFGRFKRLQTLTLFINNFSDTAIATGLRQLAESNLQLRQLSIKLTGGQAFNNNLFSIFSSFESLTYLKIHLLKERFSSYSSNYGSICDLSLLTQLKHLSLTLEEFSDVCIENIDIYLPQLVSIHFNTSKAITDESLKYLSQMKYLSKLEINCFTAEEDHNITDSGVKQLIDGCPRITSLSLNQKNTSFDFDITEENIEAMISRSKQMPKIKHFFNCNINSVEKRSRFNDILNSLTPNLLINI